MKKTLLRLTVLSMLVSFPILILNAQSLKPSAVSQAVQFDVSKKLRDVEPIPPSNRDRTWKEGVVLNNEGFLEEFNKESVFQGVDPVLQSELISSRATATIFSNFGGVSNLSGVAPPDSDGDVGPNHYFQMVNLSFAIYNKSGALLYGPADCQTIWEGFDDGQPFDNTNDGDPIVLYDEYADRWIVSQFSLPNYPNGPFYELVAVSQTSDPTGAWFRYAFQFNDMPDYPKFGIWPDGYYFTINRFKSRTLRFAGAGVCVIDRDAMLSGNPASMQVFNLSTSYGSLLPADVDGQLPPNGSPNYLMNLSTTSMNLWEANIDWNNSSNSTLTLKQNISVPSYSYSGITINQPGTSQTLDPMSTRLMYRLQYRNFGSYQVMVTNHTVNANGAGQAGVRWYELRNTGSGWSIYQSGTYAPNDGNDRWMASVAMNGNGDIAVGYSVSSASTYPSIRFAGQTAGAPNGLGVLDVSETSIKAGANSQTGVNRWGDYSMMSVDPSDNNTFWYTTEYSGGGWNWRTQIASFSFGAPSPQPPVANFDGDPLTVNVGETVQFTDLSTNNPTSWLWTFNGGTPATSIVKNPSVTYNTAGTFTVSLQATNSTGSDVETKTNYITVLAPQPPVADFTADNTTILVGGTVNFTDLSTNNPSSWAWSFPGGTPASSGSQNPSVTYNSTGTFEVSLTATNAVGSDSEIKTGYITVLESFNYCTSQSTSNAIEWISNIAVGTFSNPSGASFYSDFTSQTINLSPGSSYTITLTPHFVNKSQREFWKIWIDFNNDGDFDDTGEEVFAANNQKGTVNGSISVPSGVSGQTRIRITMKNGSPPTSCETFGGGEVEDYTADFGGASQPVFAMPGTKENDIIISPNPNNGSFKLIMTHELVKGSELLVINMSGQTVARYLLEDSAKTLDLSRFGTGLYQVVVKNGNETYKTKVLVK